MNKKDISLDQIAEALRTEDCPRPEVFLPDEWQALSEIERARVERHAGTCAACTAERSLAQRFETADRSIDSDDPLLAQANSRISFALAKTRRAHSRAPTRLLPPHWWGAVAASLVVVAAFGIFVLQGPAPPRLPAPLEQTDLTRGATVTLLAPVGELMAAPEEFRWAAVDDAAGYRITITTVAGDVVVRDEIELPQFTPAANQRARQQPGVRYHWRVEALDKAGVTLAQSREGEYRLLPD